MKWTDELIKDHIKEVMKKLNINRMPTGDELKEVGMNALHCKISRTKKYSGWAEELGLDLKSGSQTRKGTKYEDFVASWLEGKGFSVERTSHKHPYDLQVDGCVKIDVKVSSPYVTKSGTSFIFSGMKGMPTCDIYILVTLTLLDHIENIYVIPSHNIQQQSLNLREKYYPKYKYKWETIKQYSDFFKSF